jgi:hypothetical protein
VDAYLATCDETNPQPKWRHKKAARVSGTGRFLAEFEEAMVGPVASSQQSIEAHVAVLLQRSNTLNCCIQLGCHHDTLVLGPGAPTGSSVIARTLEARLSRRYDGSVIVADLLRGAAAALSPVAAMVFGCADGRWSADQIAKHVTSHFGRDSAADVAEVVQELSKRDFLVEVTQS